VSGEMSGSWAGQSVAFNSVGESAQPYDVGGPSDEPNVDSFESMHSSDKQWERDEGAYWSAQTGGQQGTPPESLTSLGGDGTDAVSRTHAPIDLDETLAQCGGFLMSSKWTVQGSRSPAAHLFGSSAPSDPDTSPESETSSETSSAPWYQDSAVGWDNIDLRDPQSIMSVPISIQHFENSVHQAVDIACGGGGGGGRGENSSRRSRSPDHSNVSIIQGPRTEKDVVARLMKAVKQKKSFRGTITNYDALQRPLSNTLEVTPVQVLSVDKFYFLTTSHITHHPPSRHIVSLPPKWSCEWSSDLHPSSTKHCVNDAVEQTRRHCHALTTPDIACELALSLGDAKTVGRFSQVCRGWRAAGMCSSVWSRLNDSRWPASKTKKDLLVACKLLNKLFAGVSPCMLFRRRLESERARSGTAEAQLCNYAWAVELTELTKGTGPPVCLCSAVLQKDSRNKAAFDEFPDIFQRKLSIPIQDLVEMRDRLHATVQLIHVPTVSFVRIASDAPFGTADGDSDPNVSKDQSFSATWPLPNVSIREEEWLPILPEIGVQLELDGSDPGLNGNSTMLALRLTVDGDEPTLGEFLRAAAIATIHSTI
jgi:hypothetical protein